MRTGAVRRALVAPEIERFLSRESVDLLVTDQVEALKVRVGKGVEVLERRLAAALAAARRRALIAGATILAGLALAGAHAVLVARGRIAEGGGILLWGIAAIALAVIGFAVIDLARVLADARYLSGLRGRHAARVDRASSAEEVLRIGEEALEDARAAGAVERR